MSDARVIKYDPPASQFVHDNTAGLYRGIVEVIAQAKSLGLPQYLVVEVLNSLAHTESEKISGCEASSED